MKISTNRLLPVAFIFLLVNLSLFFFKPLWVKYNVDYTVLAGANTIFFIAGIIVFFMQKNALGNSNPNVFIRSVIAGMMIKMFTCVLAVLAYVVLTGESYNKKAVFISLVIYLVYLAAEVAAIIKLNKKPHA